MNCRKLIWAKEYGGNTLVGVDESKGYPLPRGNCCSVVGEDGKSYSIVNFVAENLQELEKRGLKWPIKIEVLAGHTATIADRRIPPEWYKDTFCTTCTPSNLLPYPQQLQQQLEIERGQREEKGGVITVRFGRPQEFEYADAEYKESQRKIQERMKKWTVTYKEPAVVMDPRGLGKFS